MQARAAAARPARPPGHRRRAHATTTRSTTTTTTTLLPPPPPPPASSSAGPQQPPTLRQLYPFEPSAPPLLAGTLPGAAADGGGADDANQGAADEKDDPHHRFYFEVRGNPLGLPALVLHGGPGAGSYPSHARFFDPARYCVVLLDQRGCGRSGPLGALRANDAPALLRDAERLRAHLGAPAWACVLGGSWGAALGLEYAVRHPESVRALVLRAVCTMRPHEEIGWLYRGGAGALLRPEAWRAFLAHVGMAPEGVAAGIEDPLPAYYERLLSDDLATRDAAVS